MYIYVALPNVIVLERHETLFIIVRMNWYDYNMLQLDNYFSVIFTHLYKTIFGGESKPRPSLKCISVGSFSNLFLKK